MSQNKADRTPLKGELESGSDSRHNGSSSTLVNIAIAVFCVIYLINPTAGFIEFIPDYLPIIGNLDEATATAGLLYALSGLGLIPWSRKP